MPGANALVLARSNLELELETPATIRQSDISERYAPASHPLFVSARVRSGDAILQAPSVRAGLVGGTTATARSGLSNDGSLVWAQLAAGSDRAKLRVTVGESSDALSLTREFDVRFIPDGHDLSVQQGSWGTFAGGKLRTPRYLGVVVNVDTGEATEVPLRREGEGLVLNEDVPVVCATPERHVVVSGRNAEGRPLAWHGYIEDERIVGDSVVLASVEPAQISAETEEITLRWQESGQASLQPWLQITEKDGSPWDERLTVSLDNATEESGMPCGFSGVLRIDGLADLDPGQYAAPTGATLFRLFAAEDGDEQRYAEIASWWDTDIPLGVIHAGARQLRPIARLAFFFHFRAFQTALENARTRMSRLSEFQLASAAGLTVPRSKGARNVFIVTSLCGGTGAGIFLDVAFWVKRTFPGDTRIVAVLAMPSVFEEDLESDLQKRRIKANAYAALKEMEHFQAGPPATISDEEMERDYMVKFPGEDAVEAVRPFSRVFLIERTSEGDESFSKLSDVWSLVAQHIFLDIGNPIGARLDELDVNITNERERRSGMSLAYSSFASTGLILPVDTMLDVAADDLALAAIDELTKPVSHARSLQLAQVASSMLDQLRADQSVSVQERLLGGAEHLDVHTFTEYRTLISMLPDQMTANLDSIAAESEKLRPQTASSILDLVRDLFLGLGGLVGPRRFRRITAGQVKADQARGRIAELDVQRSAIDQFRSRIT